MIPGPAPVVFVWPCNRTPDMVWLIIVRYVLQPLPADRGIRRKRPETGALQRALLQVQVRPGQLFAGAASRNLAPR